MFSTKMWKSLQFVWFYVGGICVLPKTMQEALKYFEMDSILSVKERDIFRQRNLTVITN